MLTLGFIAWTVFPSQQQFHHRCQSTLFLFDAVDLASRWRFYGLVVYVKNLRSQRAGVWPFVKSLKPAQRLVGVNDNPNHRHVHLICRSFGHKRERKAIIPFSPLPFAIGHVLIDSCATKIWCCIPLCGSIHELARYVSHVYIRGVF